MRVKCISLWQPWASLMACGAKTLETRSWDTQVRGEIYIHAAKTFEGLKSLYTAPLAQLESMEKALDLRVGQWAFELPFGQIIAKGVLSSTGPVDLSAELWPDQVPFGDFTPGRFGHHYKLLQAIEPVPFRGAQGFFYANLPEGQG